MFRQDFTCPALLKDHSALYAYGAITRYGRTFQTVLLIFEDHWPVPLSLATTDGISLMSVPPGTEMFQFPGFASSHYVFM